VDIGGIGESQLAIRMARPDRIGRRIGEAAQRVALFCELAIAQRHFRQLAAEAGEFANPHDGLPANGAPHRLDGAAGGRREIEDKAFAGIEQRIDGVIHAQRRFRRQPGAESKDALRLMRLRILRHHDGGVAGDFGTRFARSPGDQHLRLGEQQRAKAIGFGLHGMEFVAQLGLGARSAQPVAHQQDRTDHGKAEHGTAGGERCDFLAVEIDEAGQCERRVFGGERAGGECNRRTDADKPVTHHGGA